MSVLFGLENSGRLTTANLYQNVAITYLGMCTKYEIWEICVCLAPSAFRQAKLDPQSEGSLTCLPCGLISGVCFTDPYPFILSSLQASLNFNLLSAYSG